MASENQADTASLRQKIADLVTQFRDLHEALPTGPSVVQSLNAFIFQDLQIVASEELRDPDNLLLSPVLARKRGYCIGIAALYLALAEQLDVPMWAVATPTHVFVRYDDGTRRINIEPFQQGADLPDDQYAREHRIPARAIDKGVFLRNLSVEEFLARAHNNLGVIYSERKDFERAAAEYERAIDLDSRFPAPLYNLGNDLILHGDPRRAVRQFTKALRLHSSDVWALNNRGLAYMKTGRQEKARKDFEAALAIDPGFEPARKNLDTVTPGRFETPPT